MGDFGLTLVLSIKMPIQGISFGRMIISPVQFQQLPEVKCLVRWPHTLSRHLTFLLICHHFAYNAANWTDMSKKKLWLLIQCIIDESLCSFSGTTKPINWPKPVYELDPNDQANNGFLNQDFLVWMRCAALPNFRKLYGRITGGAYADGLPAGNYTLEINYSILLSAAINTLSPSS